MPRRSQIRPGRWMAIPVAVLIVFLLLVSVASGAPPTPSNVVVDGNCTTFAGEWPTDSLASNDLGEVDIPDQYDFDPIYSTVNITGTRFFMRYNTLADLKINGGASSTIYFDMDHDPNTGESQTCPSASSIGADRRVTWYMSLGVCQIHQCVGSSCSWSLVSSDCSGAPGGEGQKTSTCVEIGADGEDLSFGSYDRIALKVFFENAESNPPPSGPPDDVACFEYDVTTAVELSSFTASSQGTSADEPGLTSLWPVALVSGVVAVSAGGLVLWRRKGLAR